MPRSQEQSRADADGAGAASVDIAWIASGTFDDATLRALDLAGARIDDELARAAPSYRWHRDASREADASPAIVEAIERGADARARCGGDLALVIVPTELSPVYRREALAASSSALGVGVLSAGGLAAQGSTGEDREEQIARRLAALALHVVGDLLGLDHSEDPRDYMHPPQTAADLDEREGFDAAERAWLEERLVDVADARLEEQPDASSSGRARFYLRAAWAERRTVAQALLRARPWEMPARLPKLTAAALSSLLVVLFTAEAWELAVHQRPALLTLMAAGVGAVTSSYVIWRQGLMAHRGLTRLSEQRVVLRIAVPITVGTGLMCTYLALFGATWALAALLTPDALIARWTDDLLEPSSARLRMAAFASAVALGIGALGASLEASGHVRHVILVDEES